MDKTDRVLKQLRVVATPPTNSNIEIPNFSVVTGADLNDARVRNLKANGTATITGAITGSSTMTLAGDNSSADTAYVPMVLYNTDATPPAANTVPIGTIYVQYTA